MAKVKTIKELEKLIFFCFPRMGQGCSPEKQIPTSMADQGVQTKKKKSRVGKFVFENIEIFDCFSSFQQCVTINYS